MLSDLLFFAQTLKELYWIRGRQSCASMFMLILRRAGLAERTVFISTPAFGRAGFTLSSVSVLKIIQHPSFGLQIFFTESCCLENSGNGRKNISARASVSPTAARLSVWTWQRHRPHCLVFKTHISWSYLCRISWYRCPSSSLCRIWMCLQLE